MDRVFARSVRENTEYGGEVVQVGGGFRYTQRRGTVDGVDVNTGAPGYEAAWHSHGGPDPRYDSENFSDADKDVADGTQKPIYVVTPAGKKKRYDADPNRNRQGQETEIGTVRSP